MTQRTGSLIFPYDIQEINSRVDDLEASEIILTTNQVAAITGAASPASSNVFATIDDIPAPQLTSDQLIKIESILTYYTPVILTAGTNTGGDYISLQMNVQMAGPSTFQSDFVVKAGGTPVTLASVSLAVDTSIIQITPTATFTLTDVITISITNGNVSSVAGILLDAVVDQAVTNNVTA